MQGLDAFEQAVLDKILAGDHPTLATLRVQAEGGRVVSRTFSGVGFFCELEMHQDAPRVTPQGFTLGEDVFGELTGLDHGAGFVVFVRGGLLTMLEGFTNVGDWPATITEFALRYSAPPDVASGENGRPFVEVPTSAGPRFLDLPKT